MEVNKILNGDAIEHIKQMPENFVDAIITDPPYGLEFMGKEWDKLNKHKRPEPNNSYPKNRNYASGRYDESKPTEQQKFHFSWAKECLRVLKSGGYLLSFGGTRTYHRLVCGIEDAGFEIRDTIMWLYGSGFPKSLNVGKQIDKMGSGKFLEFAKMLKEYRLKKGLSMNDVAKHFPSKTGGITGCYWNWECGNNAPTLEQYNKLIEILEIPLNKAKEFEREFIGENPNSRPNAPKQLLFGEKRIATDITKGSSEWEGWGTALKPACEPIVVARKPLSEKNVALNVLKWGTGGINIDECRIKVNPKVDDMLRKVDRKKRETETWEKGSGFKNEKNQLTGIRPEGRFPSNIILDEEAGRMLDEMSGETSKGHWAKSKVTGFGDFGGDKSEYFGKGNYAEDKGGASRFFYCAKASKSERNFGLDDFEEKPRAEINKMMGNPEGFLTGSGNERTKVWKNNHPTVKPIALMEYLIKLVTKPKAIVLDPFIGSGTTAIACLKLNRFFIGIEKEPEYIKIANARIKPFLEQIKLTNVERK